MLRDQPQHQANRGYPQQSEKTSYELQQAMSGVYCGYCIYQRLVTYFGTKTILQRCIQWYCFDMIKTYPCDHSKCLEVATAHYLHINLVKFRYRKRQEDCCERLRVVKLSARILTLAYEGIHDAKRGERRAFGAAQRRGTNSQCRVHVGIVLMVLTKRNAYNVEERRDSSAQQAKGSLYQWRDKP